MKQLFLLTITILLFSCTATVTKEGAIEKLQALPAYNCYYYAPLHIGKAVLTGENHQNPEKYIAEKYGKLIDKGLIEVSINGSNAWRTSITISLTDAGASMSDPRRSDKEHAFVAVCKVRPTVIDTIITHSKDSVECKYHVEQQDITEFGEFLGYQNGKSYAVKHIF